MVSHTFCPAAGFRSRVTRDKRLGLGVPPIRQRPQMLQHALPIAPIHNRFDYEGNWYRGCRLPGPDVAQRQLEGMLVRVVLTGHMRISVEGLSAFLRLQTLGNVIAS